MPTIPSSPTQQPLISPYTILLTGTITYIISQSYPSLIILISIFLAFFIPYAYRVNDDATSRRRFWNEFVKNKDWPKEWSEVGECVDLKERYWVNDRGMCLLTTLLLPKNNGAIKAVACFCHGYTDTPSFLKRCEYQRFVEKGIAVVSIEYEGHGRSDGLLGMVPDFRKLVDDTSGFFKEVIEERFKGVSCFLVGESMGGAVAYYTYERNPPLWTGIIFIAPMCKISDEMKPPEFIARIFRFLAGFNSLASLPITPSSDVQHLAFKLKEKQLLGEMSPGYYERKPRLATARELLMVTDEISGRCGDFDAPFLIMHGMEDKVTCPKLSQLFYDLSRSKDKEIKLYDGMWHTITSGEPPENTDIVFNDAISWLLARA